MTRAFIEIVDFLVKMRGRIVKMVKIKFKKGKFMQ